MTREIKKLYAEYKKAHENTERVELDASEEDFDKALDYECEKLDELVDVFVELMGGLVNEFDVRTMILSPKYAERFENIVNSMAA